ncbi:MAG: hypothetical protein KDA74_12980, partial [Planctomycetaceae bacterium]|nr:hypothetical protein [Planctomycetaceae bacterium]
MKPVKQVFGTSMVALLVLSAAYWGSPAFRAVLGGQVRNYTGWTEDARKADPVGFVNHIETKLKQDIGRFQLIRRNLRGELNTLTKKEKEQRALLTDAETYAAEFRNAYQEGQFPVEVRAAAYNEQELENQVGITLAEIDAYQQNVQKLSQVRQNAELKIEELIVCIDKSEAQLTALSTQRELLKVRELTTDGARLLSQVDQLLHRNEEVMTSNPVRSVRELQLSGKRSHNSSYRTR